MPQRPPLPVVLVPCATVLLASTAAEGAELVDPAPLTYAGLPFVPGETVADPVHDVVYLLDDTRSRVLAYHTAEGRLSAASALDGDPHQGIPFVSRTSDALWVLLPGAQRAQKLSRPGLRTLDIIHMERSFYSMAEGPGGNLYGVWDGDLYQIDADTGATMSVTAGVQHDYLPMLKSAYGGARLFVAQRGLSGLGDAYEEYELRDPAPPRRVGGLADSGVGSRDFEVDELYGRFYRTTGGTYGVSVWDEGTGALSFWPYDEPYGSAICILQDGASVYGACPSRIRRFRRSNGVPIWDYDEHLWEGDIVDRSVEIAPNGHLVFLTREVSDRFYIGHIGGSAISLLGEADAPVASAGPDREIAAGDSVMLLGDGYVSPGGSAPPPSSLVGWWPLDETWGATVPDASPAGRHVTVEGSASWTSGGRHGRALALSGGYVDLNAHKGAIDAIQEGAICAWFKTAAAGDQIIFGAADMNAQGGTRRRFRLFLEDGRPVWETLSYSHVNTRLEAPAIVNDGEWHHIAMSQEEGGFYMYLDGARMALGSNAFFNETEDLGSAYFGRGTDGGGNGGTGMVGFQGQLDDLRIYGQRLAGHQIAAIASSLGAEPVTFSWEKASGPGEVLFSDPASPITSASFSIPGDYVLRLTAASGGRTGSDTLRVSMALPEETLLAAGAPCRWRVPASAADLAPGGVAWHDHSADLSSWEAGTTGVGYERSSSNTYTSLIGADVEPALFDRNTSVLVHVPFRADGVDRFGGLELRMKYDDGFVAYMNGIEIARRLAPAGALAWNSEATGSHPDDQALRFEEIDVTPALHALREGDNVLAIHGLNRGLDSSDFLLLPELVAEQTGAFLLFSEWAAARGVTVAPGSDADSDGLDDFAEYAFATDILSADAPSFRIEASAAGGGFDLIYRRPAGHAGLGLSYQLERSGDLEGWTLAEGAVEVETVPAADGVENVRLRAPGLPGRHWRIRAMLR